MDLDGTLVATDLLWESLLSAVRVSPWILVAVPLWTMKGRPYLKRRLAELAEIDVATLPYRPETLALVTDAHREGRHTVLATASDLLLAERVSGHLGIFKEVLASDGIVNLKGLVKARSLVTRYGAGNFDYIGDSRADVHCWTEAADAITVGVVPTRAVPHLRSLGRDLSGSATGRLRLLFRAVRPHQWLKNLLLVVPAVGAHRIDLDTMVALGLSFISLSLAASGGYVLNDLLDLRADRRHARKRTRPFAAGSLSLPTGLAVVALAWLLGFGASALTLPTSFTALIGIYLAATAAYSLRLKKEPVLDVMFLAGLYVLRVVGGGLATGVPVSTWLLAFTLFICLSLAFLKRFIEVRARGDDKDVVLGRGYGADDAAWLQAAGLASAYLAAVVLALYVNNPDVMRLYSSPDRLLLLCPVMLYGATRVWLLAQRGRIHDDPLVALALDRVTYVLLTISVAVVLLAI